MFDLALNALSWLGAASLAWFVFAAWEGKHMKDREEAQRAEAQRALRERMRMLMLMTRALASDLSERAASLDALRARILANADGASANGAVTVGYAIVPERAPSKRPFCHVVRVEGGELAAGPEEGYVGERWFRDALAGDVGYRHVDAEEPLLPPRVLPYGVLGPDGKAHVRCVCCVRDRAVAFVDFPLETDE